LGGQKINFERVEAKWIEEARGESGEYPDRAAAPKEERLEQARGREARPGRAENL
jgi:hypothetical protein